MPRAPRSSPDPVLTLATFLPYRLNVVAASVSEGLARIYSDRFGLGIPDWRVLATVAEFGSITAKAIGAHAHMGKVRVSRAAAALEARGLIRRDRNAADMREAFLVLTPQGEAVYAEIVPLALDYVARLTADLGHADIVAIDLAITTLTRAADRMDR